MDLTIIYILCKYNW